MDDLAMIRAETKAKPPAVKKRCASPKTSLLEGNGL